MSAARFDGVKIFIEPPSHHFMKDRLFNADAVPFAGDRLMEPYAHLRRALAAQGVAVRTIDALPERTAQGRSLYVSIGALGRYAAIARRPDITLSAFFALECPANDPRMYARLGDIGKKFRRVFSWSDSEALRPFTGTDLTLQRLFWPQSFSAVHDDLWSRTDRRFLVIMQGNKIPALSWGSLHQERLKAIEHFGRTNDIDLYGREWNQPPHRVGYSRIPYTIRKMERGIRAAWDRLHPDPLLAAARRAWRGPAASKSQTISGYTFAICFENMVLKGWITEKIFDCFFAGTIPVYWGAPEINQVIPPECYVDMRQFDGYSALRTFLKGMAGDKVRHYREAARDYLTSAAFRPFSKDAFADLFLRMIREDAESL